MKKWKERLLLSLTGGIILLCGQFPELLSKNSREDIPHYWEISQISYDLSTAPTALTYEEKLLLLDKRWLSSRDEDSVLTPEQVRRAAYDGLQPYAENNLIPQDYAVFDFSSQSYMCYDQEDPEVYNRIWNVTMSYFTDGTHEPSATMGVIIDDATGTILRVSYYEEEAFCDRPISSEIDVLRSVFLNPLSVLGSPTTSMTGEECASQFYGIYPKGTIEFRLHRDGFEIKIDADANWMQ